MFKCRNSKKLESLYQIQNIVDREREFDLAIQRVIWLLVESGLYMEALVAITCPLTNELICRCAPASAGSTFNQDIIKEVAHFQFSLDEIFIGSQSELENHRVLSILKPGICKYPSSHVLVSRIQDRGTAVGFFIAFLPSYVDLHKDPCSLQTESAFVTLLLNLIGKARMRIRMDAKDHRDSPKLKFFNAIDTDISDAFFILNSEMQIVFCNQAACALFGCDKQEMTGIMIDCLFESAFTKESKQAITNKLKQGENVEGSNIGQVNSGRTFPLEYRMIGLLLNDDLNLVTVIIRDTTLKVQQEKEFKRNQEKFQTIIGTINDIVLELDEQWRIQTHHDKLADRLGISPEELLISSFLDFVHPDDRVEVLKVCTNAISGHACLLDFRILTNANETIFLSGNFRSTVIGKAELGISIILNDITEKVHAALQIKSLNLFLNSIIENANVWIDVWEDQRKKLILWNRAAEQISGYSREEISNYTDPDELFYPEPVQRRRYLDEYFRQISEFGEVSDFITEVTCKNGTQKMISWNSKLLILDEGSASRIVSFGRDITEKHRVQNALLESEEKFRTLAENSPDMIFRISVDKRIIYCSSRIKSFFDVDLSMIEDQYIEQSDLDEKLKITLNHSVDDLFSSRTRQSQCVELNLTINEFVFDVRLIPEEKHPEKPGSYVCILRDITAERTMQEQIQHYEKMQAIGQLAGGVAHDFNNQLSAIIGYTDLLQNSLVNEPKLLHWVVMIRKASKRSTDLTSQLLAFARKGKYRTELVDIHQLLDEVSELLFHGIDQRIDIKTDLNSENFFVIGDATQIQNALLNLGLNARDAMPSGGTLTFRTRDVEFNNEATRMLDSIEIISGKYIEISVIDTGFGIDEAIQTRIFEPFFTTKSEGQGTGMGLAAVYGTVINHKGIVRFNSVPGKGSEFQILFPVTDQPSVAIKTEIPRPHHLAASHFLVIDEDDLAREVMCEVIRVLNHECSCFADSETAIDYYRTHWREVELVFLEVEMQDMSSWEIVRRLKSICPSVRIILSSGYPKGRKSQQLISEGAKAFLQKPFTIEELERAISEAY